MGHSFAMGAIVAAMTLAGSKLNNAIAWGLVPFTVYTLQGILQGRPQKLGTDIAGQYLIVAINVFM
jgi:hypothetical protein